jgi:hypothetical protein
VVLNSGGKKKERRRRLIPKIVATFIYASSEGQRTPEVNKVAKPANLVSRKYFKAITLNCHNLVVKIENLFSISQKFAVNI